MTLYYSVRTRQALKEAFEQVPLGLPHYSYGIVCSKFLRLFADLGIEPTELLMPEMYPSSAYVNRHNATMPRPIHLMFKSFEEFRLLKGAYNLAHVAWEYRKLPTFDRLPKFHAKWVHPLNDYIHALSLPDEIWVGCAFTKETLIRAGVSNVHVIPAPIAVAQRSYQADDDPERPGNAMGPLQIFECTRSAMAWARSQELNSLPGESLFWRMDDCKSRSGKIFLSVFNPHDPRKNPGAMLAGFQRYVREGRQNDLLVIKILVDDNYNKFSDVLRVILPRRCAESLNSFDFIDCKNIVLVCGLMTDQEMGRLYSAADFYLCTSNAEGQNLPLLEAMARGALPISPATTAMADYICDDNAIVLPTTEGAVYDSVATAYGLQETVWDEVLTGEVAAGLERARSLHRDTIEVKRGAAVKSVRDRYAPEIVSNLVQQRLGAIELSRQGDTSKPVRMITSAR